jgi:hypothetical protein
MPWLKFRQKPVKMAILPFPVAPDRAKYGLKSLQACPGLVRRLEEAAKSPKFGLFPHKNQKFHQGPLNLRNYFNFVIQLIVNLRFY